VSDADCKTTTPAIEVGDAICCIFGGSLALIQLPVVQATGTLAGSTPAVSKTGQPLLYIDLILSCVQLMGGTNIATFSYVMLKTGVKGGGTHRKSLTS
jgi:hypothetical protein